MAVTEQTEPKKAGPSIVLQLALLVGLTLVAAGMGWVTGDSLHGEGPSEKTSGPTGIEGAHEAKSEGAGAQQGEGGGEEGETASAGGLIALDPITTNLASPSDVWVRLELALVFDGATDAAMAQQIHQDFIAYLRTVKLEQIESASGFRHLKTDLEERASIRSDGRVSEILIKTLLFE